MMSLILIQKWWLSHRGLPHARSQRDTKRARENLHWAETFPFARLSCFRTVLGLAFFWDFPLRSHVNLLLFGAFFSVSVELSYVCVASYTTSDVGGDDDFFGEFSYRFSLWKAPAVNIGRGWREEKSRNQVIKYTFIIRLNMFTTHTLRRHSARVLDIWFWFLFLSNVFYFRLCWLAVADSCLARMPSVRMNNWDSWLNDGAAFFVCVVLCIMNNLLLMLNS